MKLKSLMEGLDVHAVMLQESKLRPSSKSSIFPKYTTVRVDRPIGDGEGGLLAIVRKDVPFTNSIAKTLANFPIDRTREILTVAVYMFRIKV